MASAVSDFSGCRVVDARGEVCPVPLQMAEAVINSMTAGQVLVVQSTDPAAEIDFEAWCATAHHSFLGSQKKNGWREIRLRCSGVK